MMSWLLAIMISSAFAERTDPCHDWRAEVRSWGNADVPAPERKVPATRRARALGFLRDLKYPTDRELREVTDVAKSGTFMMNGCVSERLDTARALMNSARYEPKFQVEVKAVVKKALLANKYPTLMNVMMDVVIAEHALNSGLFQGDLVALKRLREETKRSSSRFSSSTSGSEKPTLDSVRKNMQQEKLAAQKHLEDLRKIVAGFR